MKITDLSHVISSSMPMYPGSAAPVITTLYDVEKDGFRETEIKLSSHTGTHIDAPFHMIEEGAKLGEYGIERFFGKGLIIDCTHLQKDQIEADDLLGAETQMGEVDFVIIKTGWSRYWETPGYMEGYPALSIEAAQFIAENELKGIGIDTVSIDVFNSESYPVHHVFFRKNILVIENLCNLNSIKARTFYFGAMPLNLENADASPVRAFALEERLR